MGHIIHACPFQRTFRKSETARFNNVAYDAKTRRGPQYRPDISRNVWLIKRNAHATFSLDANLYRLARIGWQWQPRVLLLSAGGPEKINKAIKHFGPQP
jgi:hypothetical protein